MFVGRHLDISGSGFRRMTDLHINGHRGSVEEPISTGERVNNGGAILLTRCRHKSSPNSSC